MPCAGCQQRRLIGQRVVAAMRNQDYTGMFKHLREMKNSVQNDIKAVAPNFRVKAESMPNRVKPPPPPLQKGPQQPTVRLKAGSPHRPIPGNAPNKN